MASIDGTSLVASMPDASHALRCMPTMPMLTMCITRSAEQKATALARTHPLSRTLPDDLVGRILQVNLRSSLEDYLLLVWPGMIELWSVYPVHRVAYSILQGVSAVCTFEWRDGRQYLLVGTSNADLHLLQCHDELQILRSWGGEPNSLRVLASRWMRGTAASSAITAVAARLARFTERLADKALVAVGFDNGCVETFNLNELFADLHV